MKKVLSTLKVFMALLLAAVLSTVPVFAEGITGEKFNLVSEDSGYTITVPNFIDLKTVKVDGADVTVIVMETPQKDSGGKYPVFEIETADSNAFSAVSYPGIMNEGQIGNFEGQFKDGKLVYSPELAIQGDLKDLSKDLVYTFDFAVYDSNNNAVFSVIDINFMFVDKSQPAAPKTVTAKPASSKVVVNGKQTAFEAYEIEGSNYFKLRDLAMAVNGSQKQFQIGWDGVKNAISLTTGTAYTPAGGELAVSKNPTAKNAVTNQSKIYLNGQEVQFTAYTINGSNYFKLRDIAKVIDFAVTWDAKLNMVGIDTSAGYTE